MSKSHRRLAEHTEIFCFLEHRFNNILQAHVLRASNGALCCEEENRSVERWERAATDGPDCT